MQFMDDPFGQFGSGGFGGGPMSMGGPSGFAGDMPPMGGMFGAPQQKKKNNGFNPLMMLSPMLGMMMQHPKAGLFGLSPALGIANLLGAFK